ncbi:inositol monophosphatase [Sphaerisporangium siamense]|uniref:Myo-inositol-1(Or 4)-monophosphatase n=1 Tax=Sphaerisporangium siamense TaxID=795645 RepID=A0A7W7GCK9_9ACTN|nr:inositol monophosphatase [Sphaerisporangium siamense]MBB4704677.1 myo-inositol-1(or 4)-monophosphatase [Sphaerisporangium siamense]GII86292.1 inositol monophosphatase [Sphaerisporangium siamense]
MDLDHARRVAVAAVEAAGDLLRERVRGTLGVRAKEGGDIVTDLDVAAEKLLLERIQGAFPGHRVVAEESGVSGAPDGEWTWLVDPLDGTNNVALGLPLYVVGVALCHACLPRLGVVHDPVARQTWWAVRGQGASGPAGPLAYRPARATPHGPVLAWTQGHGVARDDPALRALKTALDVRARRVLQLWAPLLGWVLLARGDIDAVVGYRAEAVDLPGGLLIAQEAGLTVRGFDGSRFDGRTDLPPERRSFVAARPALVDDLLGLVTAATARARA